MNVSKRKSMISGLAGVFLLVFLDQATKYAAERYLEPVRNIPLIHNIIELYYVRNRGAAFGMLSGRQWLFVILAIIMAGITIWYYIKVPVGKHYRVMRIFCILICAGALGNMIDRIWHNYVTDFIYLSFINFPVFNLADCYVCVGALLAVISLCTIYHNDENI